MGDVVDITKERDMIHMRKSSAAHFMWGSFIIGLSVAAFVAGFVSTNGDYQDMKAEMRDAINGLQQQVRDSEERLMRRFEDEADDMNDLLIAAQRDNLSNYQMAWAHMVELSTTMERSGVKAPPMPEFPVEE